MTPEPETEFASEEKRARDLGKVLAGILAGADRALALRAKPASGLVAPRIDHGGRGETQ